VNNKLIYAYRLRNICLWCLK